MKKIGYARVSTEEQTLALQLDALKAAGCRKIFQDEGVSGATAKRAGLDEALASLKRGDVLVVWKLDRLGRSLQNLIETINKLGAAGVGFRSLSEEINTTSAGGRLVFHIMGALSEFERGLIAERTKAGMGAAKRRGKHVGRPKALSRPKLKLMGELLEQGHTQRETAALLGVSENTIRRAAVVIRPR